MASPFSCDEMCKKLFTTIVSQNRTFATSRDVSDYVDEIATKLKSLKKYSEACIIKDAIFNSFLRLVSQFAELDKEREKRTMLSDSNNSQPINQMMEDQSGFNSSQQRYDRDDMYLISIIQTLLLCLQAAERLMLDDSILAFGDIVDLYTELLEECSLIDSIFLCEFFLSRRHAIRHLLDSQKSAPLQRVARARILGITTTFERKLKGTPGSSSTIARLRLGVMDMIPKCFHGLCNRGTRDLKPQHFQISLPTNRAEQWGPTDLSDGDVEMPSKEDAGSVSDSSSGSVRNFQQSGEKRRRANGSNDVSEGTTCEGGAPVPSETRQRKTRKAKQSPVNQGSETLRLEKRIYPEFWNALNFVQDPITVLSSLTLGEALKLMRTLSDIIQLFKLKTIKYPFLRDVLQLPLPITLDHALSPTISLQFFKSPIFSSPLLAPFFDPYSSKPPSSLSLLSSFDPTPHNTEVNPTTPSALTSLSLLIERSSLNSKPTFSAFRNAIDDDFFRRSLLHRFSAFLRGLKVKSRKTSLTSTNETHSLFDTLASELKVLVKQFSDSLYRLLKRLPTIPVADPPVPSSEGLPWFISSSAISLSPIENLSVLGGEFDSQEVMMARWKREGCNEAKEPNWRKNEMPHLLSTAIKSINEVSSLPTSVLSPDVSSHSSETQMPGWWTIISPASGISTRKAKRSNLDHDLLARWKSYSMNALPILQESNGKRTSEQRLPLETNVTGEERCVETLAGKILVPPRFDRERIEWYLDPPKELNEATIGAKLFAKFEDYKAKVVSDEDPVNDIREDEKIVKDPVFQWRCHRLLNLTNLHLYDHSNQDKELRSKIREASVEDLIQAVIKRSTTSLHSRLCYS